MSDFRYTDAHVHTNYSRNDCKQPMNDYLDLLRKGQSAGIGFADHLHPNREALGERYAGLSSYRFDGESYIRDIRGAQREGLHAYAGVEITYEPVWAEACRRRAYDNDYDYRIASVHSIGGLWVTRTYWQNVEPGSLFLDVVNRYYDAVLAALEVEWADVIAHIGVYRRFLPDDHPLMAFAKDLIEKREDETAKACARSGKIVEVNTSGLFKACACTMPNKAFLTKYRNYGGDRICLSSDAHDIKDAHAGFSDSAWLLKELGFSNLYPPWADGGCVSV